MKAKMTMMNLPSIHGNGLMGDFSIMYGGCYFFQWRFYSSLQYLMYEGKMHKLSKSLVEQVYCANFKTSGKCLI